MKKRILLLILPILLLIGVSYAFFIYRDEGNSHVAIAGNLYLNMTGDNSINMTGMYPMTDEDGIVNGVKYNFSVNGYNTTDKKIDYGVYVVDGDEISGKTKLRYTDIKVYLEESVNGEKTGAYGPINLVDFNKNLIYANTVGSNVKKENQVNIDYTLTMWIDEKVLISDTETEVFGRSVYTSEEFKNSYTSLKLKVEGLTRDINLPLILETSDSFVENNQAYFYARISNYNNESEIGTNSNDKMRLEVVGDDPNVTFSYKDSEGNIVEETSSALDLNYVFNKKKDVEIQIFYSLESENNEISNVNLRLTKNGELLQNVVKSIVVSGSNYCLVNGFDKLYDCILVSDSLASNVETAKVNIQNKGEPNLNDTAPSYTYVEQETLDVNNVYHEAGYKFYLTDSYYFNPSTGAFKLQNTDGSKIIVDNLSDNYKNYYTCGGTNLGYSNCNTIYRIKETNINGDTQYITLGDKITYKLTSTIRSEVGLYKSEDDYGDSYFYRGDVSNNNVYFGGYYWKIIRTNGDNSIRLIYNGTTSNAIGSRTSINNTTYPYGVTYPLENSPVGVRSGDPTYVGYMFGKNFELQTSGEVTYTNFVANTKYYFADDYETNAETETFTLKKKERDPIYKTLSEMNTIDEETGKYLYQLYPYTCRMTTLEAVAQRVYQINSISSSTSAKVQYIQYSSTSLDGTRTNEMNSNAKIQIENWYKTNIVGKIDDTGNLITNYIVDGTFCNDRSITHASYNSGYLVNKATYYASYSRLSDNKTASLKCSRDKLGNIDERDWFSEDTERGNGLLEYPVALVTADEVALAGGKANVKNLNYYLNTKGDYYTMTPSVYSEASAAAAFITLADGSLKTSGWSVGVSCGMRPVINLRSDVLISQGDGTTENPFQLRLS